MSSTAFMFGSSTDDSEPLMTGRMAPLAPPLFAISMLVRELHEVDRLGRRVLADREAVAAAELLVGRAGAAVDGREREPAHLRRLVLGVGREGGGRPLAHQVHRRAAVAHRRGLAAGAVPRGGQEALLERLHVDQPLELLAGLDEALAVERAVLAGLLHRVRTGDAQRQVGPPEHAGPLVLLAERDRGDAGGLELLDGGQEVVPRGGRLVDARLLEQRGVVPDPHHAQVVGDAVLLAVDLVEADARLIEVADPVRGRLA